MQVHEDGSVVLNPNEVAAVAKVLDLGRALAESMGAEDAGINDEATEVVLLQTINLLDDLGVSSDELTERLDRRRRPG